MARHVIKNLTEVMRSLVVIKSFFCWNINLSFAAFQHLAVEIAYSWQSQVVFWKSQLFCLCISAWQRPSDDGCGTGIQFLCQWIGKACHRIASLYIKCVLPHFFLGGHWFLVNIDKNSITQIFLEGPSSGIGNCKVGWMSIHWSIVVLHLCLIIIIIKHFLN